VPAWRASVVALGLAAGLAPAAAQPPLITWMQADTPPFHIGEGPLAGQGVKDRQYQFLSQHLPRFQHRQMIASVARNWYDLEHSDGICIIGVARTPEREKYTLFSERQLTGYGSRIIVRRDGAAKFKEFLDSHGAVDLSKLARSDALVGGFVAALHYGDSITAFIGDEHRIARLDKFVTPPQLFNVLNAGRLDYVFGQPVEAAYFSRQHGMKASDLVALQIAGGAQGGGLSVGCSNGLLGRQVIQAIDRLLADDRLWRDYTAPYNDWTLEQN